MLLAPAGASEKRYRMTKRSMTVLSRRRTAILLLILAALVGYQCATSSVGAAAQEPRDKVEAALLESLAAGGEATFYVMLHEEANLAPAYGLLNRNARGTFVFEKLNEVADRTQADLRAMLDARGVRYRPFWIVNAIRVTAGEAVLMEIAARPEVKSIHAEKVYRIPPPQAAD
jgi:hypothetical protein